MTREQLLAALRNADAAGDEEAARRFAAMIAALPQDAPAAPQAVEAPASTPTMEAENGSLNEDDLRADPDFVAAARITFERHNGAVPEGMDDIALANYALDDIGTFNNNIVNGGFKAASLLTATPEQKRAYLYLMDSSEKLGWSWEAFGHGVRGIATDPTTYVGIGTLGFGTAVAQTGKALTREAVKEMLRAGVNMGVKGAVEGAIYGAAQEGIRQTVSVQGGGQEGYNLGDIAMGAATGAAVGTVLGGTLGAGESALKTRAANKLIDEAEAVFQPAPGAAVAPPVNPAVATPVTPNVPVETTLRAANDTATPPVQAPGQTVSTTAKIPEGLVVANPGPANQNLKGLSGPILGAQTHLNDIVDAIRVLSPTDNPASIRQIDGTQKLKLLNAATKGIGDMLEHAARLGDGATLTDLLLRTGVTGAQMQVLKNSAQQANDGLLREIVKVTKEARAASPADAKLLRETVNKLENTRASVQRLDMDLSTQSGRDLRMRQEGLNAAEVRGLSVKQLMEEGGLSRKEAEGALIRTVEMRESMIQNKAALDALNTRIDIATKAKDYTLVQQLRAEKTSVLNKVDDQLAPGGKPMGQVARFFHKALEGVLEVMISNVFSTSTIIINTVPTYLKIISKPLLNYISKGVMEPGALRGMLASYGALNTMQAGAFKAAGVAFKYERSLLLQDTERAFFGSNVIPKRFGGGIIRFLPRMLNATDEYMAQLAYRSYGVAEATAAAVSDAKLNGLKGKDLDTFVEMAV